MKLFITFVFILIASAAFSQETSKNFPEDYPADLPKPKITKSYESSKQESGTVFQFDTDLSGKETLDFFVAEMGKEGYEVANNPLYSEDNSGGSGQWRKGKNEVSILIVKAEENKTFISITYK
jgi:hypothetical protein